jgi:hypothetical protein
MEGKTMLVDAVTKYASGGKVDTDQLIQAFKARSKVESEDPFLSEGAIVAGVILDGLLDYRDEFEYSEGNPILRMFRQDALIDSINSYIEDHTDLELQPLEGETDDMCEGCEHYVDGECVKPPDLSDSITIQ